MKELTVGELLAELEEAGLLTLTGRESTDESKLELNDWLDNRGVDPDTPVPVWNEEAQAWEV